MAYLTDGFDRIDDAYACPRARVRLKAIDDCKVGAEDRLKKGETRHSLG